MRYLSGLLILATVSAVPGQDKPPAVPQAGAYPVVHLAPQSAAKQVGALHYRLLPGPLDRTPGNAATLWRLAGEAFHQSDHKMTIAEFDWAGAPALKDLPRKEVRELLSHYTAALRLAHQAARCERCDWEMPPLTVQLIQDFSFSQETIQRGRTLINLLCIQCRLQLAEGRFEDAIETLQTGFAMARDFSNSDSMIFNLVGIALDAIMFSRVQEWLQMPGSPNLYWALTNLPPDFLNVRRAFEHELHTFHRSYPRLRRLNRETLTERQADELLRDVFSSLAKNVDQLPKQLHWLRDLTEPRKIADKYPSARQHLLDLGRPAKEVDALPKSQVVLLHYLNDYERVRDDILKALALPPWQAWPLIEDATQPLRAAGETGNPFVALLMPTVSKVYSAYMRVGHQIAGFRAAEALRLYAATHDGKPPAKWTDITDVPLPIDPATGKGFNSLYEVKDGVGVLLLPPVGINLPTLGRRFELEPKR
jgi:hypothetical protein